jgi:hypothetical protein
MVVVHGNSYFFLRLEVIGADLFYSSRYTRTQEKEKDRVHQFVYHEPMQPSQCLHNIMPIPAVSYCSRTDRFLQVSL